jgi:succinate-semialdehyde dehydrogenase / glutarate-semialdehyde dehydrogenase
MRAVRIAGQDVDALEPWPVTTIEPASETELARLVGGGARDAALAVESAHAALPAWQDSSPAERARCLRKVADDLRSAPGELAEALARDTGKRHAEATAEIMFSAAFFEWFADSITNRANTVWEVVPGVRHEVRERPIGVVAAISTWNFPASIPARKIAAAIAAGCTVVFLPSEVAPLASLLVAEIIDRNVPPGVVNTVLGPAPLIARTWLTDPRVRALTFTGSISVGQRLAGLASQRFVRCVLELGGKAPFVVLEDADIKSASNFLLAAKFRNNGQSCIAADQVWVPRHRMHDFVEVFSEMSSSLILGDPMSETTTLGPLARSSDVRRIQALLDDAAASGSTVIRPPTRVPEVGYFLAPAICVDPPSTTAIVKEEIFGPALCIRRYDEIGEVIRSVRSDEHGLAAYVACKDTGAGAEVACALDVGLVGINTATPNTPQIPFAGQKMSGVGAEGGHLGWRAFCAQQSIATFR